MSLNPDFSAADASAPCAKLSFNINAFNGNTTNFNRTCPSPKTLPMPVQPRQEVPWTPLRTPATGIIRPM